MWRDRPEAHFPAHRRRWFEAAELRHATFGPPVGPGDAVRTLCGASAVAVAVTPGRYAAQCPDCDRQWRIAEGVPLRAVAHRPARNR